MPDESATTTYSIPVPFDHAVQSLRTALGEAGLKITGQLDVSARLQCRLLVNTPPCLVLFAGPPATLTPLHIVVSARGLRTEIHLLKIPPTGEMGLFRARLSRALEKIAMRAVLGA